MPLVQVGRDRIAGLMIGTQTCHWGTSNATIWVASSTADHTGASTWFGSATTPNYGATMDATFPSAAANILQFQGTYSTANANIVWSQWGINSASASGSGVLMNLAACQALGTKTSAQSWQLTACITITT